jgi:tetratricopeptide (TPR) repeat protein
VEKSALIGDAIMKATVRMRPVLWGAALAVLVGLAGGARAEGDDKLRQEALKLNDVTGDDVMTGKIKQLLGNQSETKKLLAVAVKMAKEKEQPFEYNASFILARTAQLLKEYETSQVFYKVCSEQAFKLQSAAKLIQVYDGLIDLFYENKKYDDAVKACEEFLGLRGSEQVEQIKPFVMERLVQAKAKQGKIKEAIKLAETLAEADEGGWYFLQTKAWVQREAGQLDEAAATYQETLDKLKANKKLKDDAKDRFSDRIRYVLSGVYVDLKKVDQAAEQLQALLKKHPDNPTYNNDLGYIWADHDMKFEEAEKLIRKAIEEDRKQRKMIADVLPDEDKDNAAYLDSLGWVLYKQKKYAEAKKVMLDATKLEEGQHIEILDHLADVHMALGEKAEAAAVWKKALEQEAVSRREKERKTEVEKKLKDAEGK